MNIREGILTESTKILIISEAPHVFFKAIHLTEKINKSTEITELYRYLPGQGGELETPELLV